MRHSLARRRQSRRTKLGKTLASCSLRKSSSYPHTCLNRMVSNSSGPRRGHPHRRRIPRKPRRLNTFRRSLMPSGRANSRQTVDTSLSPAGTGSCEVRSFALAQNGTIQLIRRSLGCVVGRRSAESGAVARARRGRANKMLFGSDDVQASSFDSCDAEHGQVECRTCVALPSSRHACLRVRASTRVQRAPRRRARPCMEQSALCLGPVSDTN